MRKFKLQLKDALTGVNIGTAGGKVYVTSAGGTAKSTLYTAAGAALANPITPSGGCIEFYTADALDTVDLYGLSPTGHGFVRKSVKSSGDASLLIDATRLDTTLVIPFNVADQAGDATETSTGFALPGAVQPNVAVEIITEDASITVDVGTLASDSGDADGFMDGISTTTAGYIKPTLVHSGDTMGALLSVVDSANAGDDAPEQDTSMIGKTVTYTLLTAADTATGLIVLPIRLKPSALVV